MADEGQRRQQWQRKMEAHGIFFCDVCDMASRASKCMNTLCAVGCGNRADHPLQAKLREWAEVAIATWSPGPWYLLDEAVKLLDTLQAVTDDRDSMAAHIRGQGTCPQCFKQVELCKVRGHCA
jgi:hypothetical protein